jgi:hypothetical protein
VRRWPVRGKSIRSALGARPAPAMARQPIAASRPAPQRRIAGRQSGDGKLNEVDQLMGERRNWQLLPFIIIAGLLVGWVSGQLVSLIPPQDGPTAGRQLKTTVTGRYSTKLTMPSVLNGPDTQYSRLSVYPRRVRRRYLFHKGCYRNYAAFFRLANGTVIASPHCFEIDL